MTGTPDERGSGTTQPGGEMHIEVMENPNYSFVNWQLRCRLGRPLFQRVTDELYEKLIAHNQTHGETPEAFILKPEGESSLEEDLLNPHQHLILMMRTENNVNDIIGLGFRSPEDKDHIFILRILLSDVSNAVKTILALKGQLSLPLSEESE